MSINTSGVITSMTLTSSLTQTKQYSTTPNKPIKSKNINNKPDNSSDSDEEFDFEQYYQEKIKKEEVVKAILRKVQSNLPLQKTGEIDKRFGITKSEIDFLQKIVEKHISECGVNHETFGDFK